ncbi:hypothetical protein DR864_28120 [Runella rosea]|uniref:SGNH hydrolase-type esterase domain-containing protein n=1 Tax=Runella rosea TaxID=2259595 RepID=A0A344TRR0_9BACT|nr:SGNH/GDSL hydrolase family protein [Runella rosea]AXE16264.1 hypothetical protein DR864_00255 [Runella rosea]AXE21331.1 hypothetical protein DR864_28120 [Runella rosea]
MKKTFLLLLIALSGGVFGQVFPTKNNAPATTRDMVREDGLKISAIFGTYSAAANVAQNTVLITGRVRSTGGSNIYIEKFSLFSDRDCTVRLQINLIGGIASLAGAVNYDIPLKAGVRNEYTYESLVPWGAVISVLLREVTDTSGNMKVTLVYDGYEVTQNTDFFAPISIVGWGDSIMKGANATVSDTDPNTSYFLQVVKYYEGLGYRVKPVNKSIPGITALGMSQAKNWGYLNISNANIILICLGMNTSASEAAYIAEMTDLIRYKQRRYPNAKCVVMAPTTRLDGSETTLVGYRAALQALVNTTINDPKVKYLDLSQGYTGGAAANGVTVGDVHPNQTGHNNLATYLISYLTSNNILP